MTKPVLQNVSQATRESGSCARQASSTESLTASHSLSGWPSVTDSEVKRYRLIVGRGHYHARASCTAGTGAVVLSARTARDGQGAWALAFGGAGVRASVTRMTESP